MNSAKQVTGYAEVERVDILLALDKYKAALKAADAWFKSDEAKQQAIQHYYKYSGWTFMKKYTCPEIHWNRSVAKGGYNKEQEFHLVEQHISEIPDAHSDVYYGGGFFGIGKHWGDVPEELRNLAVASGCSLVLLSPRACHFVTTFKEKPYHEIN